MNPPATRIAALESLHDWLNTNLDEMKEETAVGREAYIYFLKHVALMPFHAGATAGDGRVRMGALGCVRNI